VFSVWHVDEGLTANWQNECLKTLKKQKEKQSHGISSLTIILLLFVRMWAVQSRFAETSFAETRFAETPTITLTLTLTLNPNFGETGFGETGLAKRVSANRVSANLEDTNP